MYQRMSLLQSNEHERKHTDKKHWRLRKRQLIDQLRYWTFSNA